MRASLIIATCDRPELLAVTLASVARQKVKGMEVLVIEDGTSKLTSKLCKQYGFGFLSTGRIDTSWRVPGFAFNIGVRQTSGDVLIFTSCDIYQVDDCLEPMIAAVEANNTALARPRGLDADEPSEPVAFGPCDTGAKTVYAIRNQRRLNTDLMFLMAMSRNEFVSIGGYDEDFDGHSSEDKDLVNRLRLNGCEYVRTSGLCIHQYHKRGEYVGVLHSNRAIYKQKRGTIVRNAGREWGQLT
jgi:GT2 family glycosyltransferase